MKASQRILVIRNDKLGDFMLAWPALALLRASVPHARIAALVPAYTAPLAGICPSVDEVIIDPKLRGDWRNGWALTQLLRDKDFDSVVTLFSRFDTGLAVWKAGIPLRFAPATKLAQVFYNRRLKQRRSESAKPEFGYNLDLIRYFLREQGCSEAVLPPPPYLHFDDARIQTLEHRFRQAHAASDGARLVCVHAGHGGSANNLSVEQYAQLIRGLKSVGGLHVVLTAGPNEEVKARKLSSLLDGIPHTVYLSRDGLVNFARQLQFCDLFVSGSTGPLHVAAALNCRTAAFFPRRRSSTALRWQTINAPERRLAFAPPEGNAENDMAAIDVTAAAVEINRRFLVR
ncbi:MAG: glycosyltransferase family 9 protein [Gammaproteobacteria bacterium]